MAKLILIAGLQTYVSRGLTYVAGVQYDAEKLGETAEDQLDGVHVFEIVGETTDAVQVIAPSAKGGDKNKQQKTISIGKGKTATVDASGDMDTGAAAAAAAEQEAADAADAADAEGAAGDDKPSVTI